MTLENFLQNPNLNWTVLSILAITMFANTIAGYLHAKTINDFNPSYFKEHTVKKLLILAVILLTVIKSHDNQMHEFGTLITSAYAVVEFKSFKKHYLDYKEEK